MPVRDRLQAIKCLVVDDEPLARLRIVKYLQKLHPAVEVLQACDGVDALECIRAHQFKVVFLDIEMPGMTGIDLLDQLTDRAFHVIFQTAYNEFAVKAFDQNACDYLLKPFTDERLERSLQKALAPDSKSDLAVGRLLGHLTLEGHFLERIAIPVGDKVRMVETKEIMYFLSDQHMTRVHLDRVDLVCDHSLTFLESRLNPEIFLRIHRNSIVKLSAILTFNGNLVELKNGVQLAVSRGRRKQVRASL